MLNSNWYCLDCRVNRNLDVHGRCETCCSEAVLDLTLSDYNPQTDTSASDYILYEVLG